MTILAVLAAVLTASTAIAAPPAGKGKPVTGEGCKPMVTVVLKGAPHPAVSPINGGEIGSTIYSASCTPKGRGVAGRYSRFTCDTRYGSSNTSSDYIALLTVRVLPVGTGKLCVVAVPYPNHPGEFLAWQASGKPTPRLKTEFACPTTA